MRGIEPFRYALSLQQLQDRKETKSDSLSKTRQRKPVQTLRKVGHHSKTLQNLQQHCSRASRYRLKVCTKQTQSQSRIPGFASKDRCAIREKALLVRVLCYAKYHSRFGEKYHPSPCFGKQERTCISSKRKERLFLFQGKEKRMFLL